MAEGGQCPWKEKYTLRMPEDTEACGRACDYLLAESPDGDLGAGRKAWSPELWGRVVLSQDSEPRASAMP